MAARSKSGTPGHTDHDETADTAASDNGAHSEQATGPATSSGKWRSYGSASFRGTGRNDRTAPGAIHDRAAAAKRSCDL